MQTSLNFDTPTEKPHLSVTQVTQKIKGLLEQGVGEVWVRGEVSGLKPSAAGHLYFSLKDAGATLSCALFGRGNRVKFEMKEGTEVLARGKISVYAPRGNYQLIVDQIEPVGLGALQLAFQQLKEKLQKEGLFDQAKKRALPPLPSKIAIVTSPTGAALQDILNILNRRHAGIHVIVVPTLVQGETAAPQIARAIEVAGEHKLGEVLIVARGGGSVEDLWCFNDERVVRAIAASPIPVISAVGHEVDFTLSDFAADLRAPTPSAAAELVSRSKSELVEQLASDERRLALCTRGRVAQAKNALLALENRLISPADRLSKLRRALSEHEIKLTHAVEAKLPPLRQIADEFQMRLAHSASNLLSQRKRQFETVSSRLEALSPLKVLGRGYTLIEDPVHGGLVKSASEATPGRQIQILFKDGKARGQIL